MTFLESLPQALFWNPLQFWWIIVIALALDLAIGDPAWLPHPVRGIGWLLSVCEKPARRIGNGLFSGVLVLLCVVAVAGGIAAGLLYLPYGVSLPAAIFLSWTGLALGALLRAGSKAVALIEAGALEEARSAVAELVTRSTEAMDEEDLCRTLAETVSENLNDAFIAPFFWLQCTGPVGLWIYKAVSTMDSMWGYRTESWRRLGWAGARLDDVLAFVPARLTACFYFLSAPLAKVPPRWPGWGHVAMQANMMDSPNAGWPMTAAAWLHGATMGGPAVYNGVTVQKPRLGPVSGQWTVARVRNLIRHTAIAGVLGAVLLWSVSALVTFWVLYG